MATEKQLAGQIDAINRLIDRAGMLVGDGDRSPYFIKGAIVFMGGQNKAGELVFNIPNDADFYGLGLNLYLGFRAVVLTGPFGGNDAWVSSDLVFRPANWANTNDYMFLNAFDANAQFELRDSVPNGGAYQSAPININSVFSARYGVVNTSIVFQPVTAYLGGVVFDTPYHLKRGSTLTTKITPNFSQTFIDSNASSGAAGTMRTEFRVTGVLRGFKKVRAFK